jgi:hypothetical protein
MRDQETRDVDQANSGTQEMLALALKNRSKGREAVDVAFVDGMLRVVYREAT